MLCCWMNVWGWGWKSPPERAFLASAAGNNSPRKQAGAERMAELAPDLC